MPWTSREVAGKSKVAAKTAKGRKTWTTVANKVLASGKSEGAAIRIANAVAKKQASKRKRAMKGTLLGR